MKKIFIIMQKEIVDTVGGTITIFIDYCNMLVNNGYNVFGLFYSDKNGKPHTLNSKVNYINIKKLANGCMEFNEAINYIAEKENPELFIFFFPRLYNLSKLDKKFDRIPRILMFHGRPDYYFNNNPQLAKELEPYYVNTISQILIPSYIDLLPNYIKNNKVVYIPNPSSIGSKVINVDCEKKKIIFLSRIAPCKGIDFLIKSFKYVAKKHSDWQLDIYGQSQPINYKDDLNYLINKLKLNNNIKIKGISNNPLNTFLDYDFCVFPSIIEGFPMGLIEAQSVGLPAIGLKGCSGVNELIIDKYNGYLSDRKYKEFASKINQLIENKEIRKIMSKNSIAEAQKYERNRIHAMWLELIKRTINGDYVCNFDKKIKCKYKLFPIDQVLKWDKYNPDFNLNLFQRIKKFIFSISKDYTHKRIIFLGIKINIKRKKTKENSSIISINERLDTLQYIIEQCCDICSFPVAKGENRKSQLANALLLEIFDKICNKYGCAYWLDFGTLLGAIRHKGFIPWDDDIDVGMMRKDYDKIIPILKKELSNEFIISDGIEYGEWGITRIIYKNSCIQLDIFPYDTYFKTNINDIEQAELLTKMDKAHEIMYENISKSTKKYPKEILNNIITKYVLDNNKPIDKGLLLRGIDFKYEPGEARIIDYGVIFPLSKIKFESKLYYAPANTSKFLELAYGNYMSFPKIIKKHNDINERILNVNLDSAIENLSILKDKLI